MVNPRAVAKGKQENDAPVNIKEQRAASPLPLTGRVVSFPADYRYAIVEQNGKEYFEVTGYATVFNKKYTMYDMFGAFTEDVDPNALDKSLAAGPDVAFLTNHRGVTMARTTNETLDLGADKKGMKMRGLLNTDRADVQLLMSAIKDELVTEMSFAFMLNDGEWDENYEHFTIKEADINRGDVSAVNYGANPYTSIEARSYQFMHELKDMPASVQRAAYVTIKNNIEATYLEMGKRELDAPTGQSEPEEQEPTVMEPQEPAEPLSRSRALYMNRLMLEDEELRELFNK
jgi:HK97 family phage prohead protease